MLAVLVSQALFALTETSPLFALTVAVIDVDVEIPVHPEGKLHVYDVAAWLNIGRPHHRKINRCQASR